MAITPKFTPASVAAMMKQKLEAIEKAMVNRLKFVGEKFVINARNNHTYKDQTGNLTSSIGYVILKDGNQIYNGFPGGTAEGKSKAINTAEQVSSRFTKGYVLIVVAGMEYAAAVEARNLDVLTASSFTAGKDLRTAIEELGGKIAKMK